MKSLFVFSCIVFLFTHQDEYAGLRNQMVDTQIKARGVNDINVLKAMKKAGKPVRPGEVAKMIGEESKDVSKAIGDLKKRGKVISPKRCYYALSDA